MVALNDPPIRLFVYNTLLEGFPPHVEFRDYGAKKLTEAWVRDFKFYMYNNVDPAAVYAPGARLEGCIYAVPPRALFFADKLFYCRMMRRVQVKAHYITDRNGLVDVEAVWLHIKGGQPLPGDIPYPDIYTARKGGARV